MTGVGTANLTLVKAPLIRPLGTLPVKDGEKERMRAFPSIVGEGRSVR